MPKLVVHPGTPHAKQFDLKPGTNYVGRGFANDIQIDEQSVSSSHAQILLSGSAVLVRDLGSTNGTFIDRSQITEAALQPGQVLRLGGIEMVLATESAAAPATIPAPPSPPPPSPPAAVKAAVPTVSAVPASVGGVPVVRMPTPKAPDVVSIPARPSGLKIPTPPAPAMVATPAAGGLRVSGPGSPPVLPPPPPTIGEPPQAPPIPDLQVQAPTVGKTNCKYHPKSPGRWLCPKCGNLYCDLCVSTRAGHAEGAYFCRSCAAPCSQVAYVPTVNPLEVGSFFTQIPGAFKYPFQKGGGILLIAATIFFVIVDIVRHLPTFFGGPFIWIAKGALTIMYFGYLYSYLQNVIHTTAQGDEHEATLPDVTDFGQDIVAPFIQLICTILVCFGPAIALALWGNFGEQPLVLLGVIPAIALGGLYFPMAFLSVAMFDTVGGINPLVVIPAMFRVPLQYLVACVLFGLVMTFYWLGATAVPLILPIPIVPVFITGFIWLYLLTVMARILGILYFVNRERFGWYNT